MSHLHQHNLGGPPVSGNSISLTRLDEFSADPGFAERAVRFSSFDGQNYGPLAARLGGLGTQRLLKTASNQPLKATSLQIGLPEGRKESPVPSRLKLDINNGDLVNSREESAVSDPAKEEATVAKKRKAPPKGKGKNTRSDHTPTDNPKVTEEDLDAKRFCSMEKNGTENDEVKPKIEQNDGCRSNDDGAQKEGKNSTTTKPPEPPKDYIHVRARRGQATDNHSLSERLRREKISQRMKLLQDLVPGCNKITGKAVMLDEIINYVQSLQRQVEFLSMKLASVNPQLDFNNLANLLPKMHQACGPMPSSVYSLETSGVTPPYVNQSQHGTSLHCLLPHGMETQNSVNLLDSTFHQNPNTQHPFLAGYGGASSQLGTLWEDNLQNGRMDLGQN
ncbi:hypothetical protein Cni_G26739 [Canna indica]|uniref:BHLH domain-containing protein n=1 Tax=Canna indica TaxID=4628 RepID=A0AAQ3QMB9_9LILI|nr:hypothetical protein Cni_G26739 [Canna indica]